MKRVQEKGKGSAMEKMEKEQVKRVVKWTAWVIAGAMTVFLAVFITLHWSTLYAIFTGPNPSGDLQAFLSSFGLWGAVILVLFQTLQIAIAFLTGEPIELVSGMMYGGIFGAALCLLGVVFGTYAVFFAIDKLGSGMIAAFHDEEKFQKFNRFGLFKSKKKAELLTFILFLIPGLPKDFFTFLAPFTPLSIHRFVLISTLGRAPGMLITTFAGASLLQGNYVLAGCLYGSLGVCAIIGLLYYRKVSKAEASSGNS